MFNMDIMTFWLQLQSCCPFYIYPTVSGIQKGRADEFSILFDEERQYIENTQLWNNFAVYEKD